MSGFSTTIIFKEKFNKKDLVNILNNLTEVKYYDSEYEKNGYDLYIHIGDETDENIGQFATINYYDNFLSDDSTTESFWDEINSFEEKFTYFIDIFYMSANPYTNQHMFKLLGLLGEVSKFYFTNQIIEGNGVEKHIIKELNSYNEILLLSSDIIPVINKNEKLIEQLGVS
ncbi:hypothetical protein [Kordia sp.]|uniref:hypothetical protein n=1 Tax=Kordia sp. TaxID=1965332 RepID=UPI003D6A5232